MEDSKEITGLFLPRREVPLCRDPSDGGAWVVRSTGIPVEAGKEYAFRIVSKSKRGNLRFAHIVREVGEPLFSFLGYTLVGKLMWVPIKGHFWTWGVEWEKEWERADLPSRFGLAAEVGGESRKGIWGGPRKDRHDRYFFLAHYPRARPYPPHGKMNFLDRLEFLPSGYGPALRSCEEWEVLLKDRPELLPWAMEE